MLLVDSAYMLMSLAERSSLKKALSEGRTSLVLLATPALGAPQLRALLLELAGLSEPFLERSDLVFNTSSTAVSSGSFNGLELVSPLLRHLQDWPVAFQGASSAATAIAVESVNFLPTALWWRSVGLVLVAHKTPLEARCIPRSPPPPFPM